MPAKSDLRCGFTPPAAKQATRHSIDQDYTSAITRENSLSFCRHLKHPLRLPTPSRLGSALAPVTSVRVRVSRVWRRFHQAAIRCWASALSPSHLINQSCVSLGSVSDVFSTMSNKPPRSVYNTSRSRSRKVASFRLPPRTLTPSSATLSYIHPTVLRVFSVLAILIPWEAFISVCLCPTRSVGI